MGGLKEVEDNKSELAAIEEITKKRTWKKNCKISSRAGSGQSGRIWIIGLDQNRVSAIPIVTTRCSPRQFVRAIKRLTGRKKEAVCEIGFGTLLGLQCTTLKRQLCTWLVSHFDPVTCELRLENQRTISIHPRDVGEILGLPCSRGSKDVPQQSDGDYKWLKSAGLKVKDALKASHLESQLDKLPPGDNFKSCFVLFACATILCPNSRGEASNKLIGAVDDVMAIRGYNWGKYVLETLKMAVTSYNAEGGCTSVNGSLLFLMVCV
ncbi:uncharacterized protein LOC132281582 [Cornus florida]|uniref:uncharacterized protein LOC132281582 n=1 Tax=Cornus florida TaxID=4283 RepID=UPI00289BE247|nr:uncharacterized protein LOC132281582 [Cornus florida]